MCEYTTCTARIVEVQCVCKCPVAGVEHVIKLTNQRARDISI